jgi:lysyl-tRNA synthetase class 1
LCKIRAPRAKIWQEARILDACESLRHWFAALYETLLGSPQGPRMGSFIALYGVENSRRLIGEALEAPKP